jgi:O-antigen ligase
MMKLFGPNEARGLSGVEGLRGALVCLTLVLCSAAYSFRFMSFLHAKEAVFCLCVCGIAITVAVQGRIPRRGFAAFAPLWLYLALATFSIVFLPVKVPCDALVQVVYWALALFATALCFDLVASGANGPVWRERVLDALVLSTVTVAALGLVQYANICPTLFPLFQQYTQRVYSVFGNQDLYGGYLAIGIPVLVRRILSGPAPTSASARSPKPKTRNGILSLLGLAVLLPGLLVSGCRSAWLAAAIGILVCIPYRQLSQRGTRRLLGLAVGVTLATAWMAPEATVQRIAKLWAPDEQGLRVRLWMWDGTLRLIQDAPLFGVGLGNYGYWSPRYLGRSRQDATGNGHVSSELHADQPHSEPLRILAETGVVGLLCWGWFLVRLLRARKRGHHPDGVPLARAKGPLAAWVVFSLFNGPFDSIAHTFAFLLLASMALRARDPEPDSISRLFAWSAPAIAAAVTGFVIWTMLIPSYLLRGAEDAHLAGRQNRSFHFALYEQVIAYPWPNATAHRDYGIALADAGRNAEAYRELLQALEGLDTGDVYLALAILAAKNGDHESAHRWAIECLLRWPANKEARQLAGANRP